MQKDLDTERDAFRRHMLDALDAWSVERFEQKDAGWKDSDLPGLFAALDAHLETVLMRLNVETAKGDA